MAAQKAFRPLVQQFLIHWVPVVQGTALKKRISNGRIPNFIAILLALAAVSGVKILCRLPAGFYRDILWQPVV